VTALRVREPYSPGSPLGGEHQVLELIATGAPLATVLDTLCRVIDEQSGLRSSIFLLDAAGERLTLIAGPHLPDVWRAAVASFPVTATACGAAVTRREQIVSSDIRSDPLYAGFHDAASASGFGAVWSTPFFSKHDRALGTFAVYSDTPGCPTELNLRLVQRATHLASIAVERYVTEEGLRESDEELGRSQHLLAEAQHLAHIGSWSCDLRTRTVTWSDELYRIFGVQPLEFDPGRDAMGLIDSDDREFIMTTVERTLATNEPYSFFYRIHRRDGAERILYSRGRVVTDEQGAPISIIGTTQDVTELRRAEEALRRSEQLLRQVVDALPVGVAVMAPGGDIILHNPASARIWNAVIGSGRERYAASKGWWHDTGVRIRPDEWASVRALVKGETSIDEVIDIESFDGVRKTIQNSAVPIRDDHEQVVGAVIINQDVTGRKATERDLETSIKQMQALATRLMHAQDDERRRIARMLHETTAQDLAALKMLLGRLNRTADCLSDADHALLAEGVELAERSMSGIRTLSYLLHPPFLDEAGLLSAIRWYVDGFAERSGIAVDLDLPPEFDRLPRDVETTLFRVVQEALINIHRHAYSPTAGIHLKTCGERLTLEVSDRGRGMSPALVSRLMAGGGALGVGIAGMRERLKQLDGTLEIESSDRGTVVRAAIPWPPDES